MCTPHAVPAAAGPHGLDDAMTRDEALLERAMEEEEEEGEDLIGDGMERYASTHAAAE